MKDSDQRQRQNMKKKNFILPFHHLKLGIAESALHRVETELGNMNARTFPAL